MILDTKKFALFAAAVVVILLLGIVLVAWLNGNSEIAVGAGATAVAGALAAASQRGSVSEAVKEAREDALAAAEKARVEAEAIGGVANEVRVDMAINDAHAANVDLNELVANWDKDLDDA